MGGGGIIGNACKKEESKKERRKWTERSATDCSAVGGSGQQSVSAKERIQWKRKKERKKEVDWFDCCSWNERREKGTERMVCVCVLLKTLLLVVITGVISVDWVTDYAALLSAECCSKCCNSTIQQNVKCNLINSGSQLMLFMGQLKLKQPWRCLVAEIRTCCKIELNWIGTTAPPQRRAAVPLWERERERERESKHCFLLACALALFTFTIKWSTSEVTFINIHHCSSLQVCWKSLLEV